MSQQLEPAATDKRHMIMEANIYYGRNIEGNFEFANDEASELRNRTIREFLKKETEIYDKIAAKNGLNPVINTFIVDTINYSNEEELNVLTSEELSQSGYKRLPNGGIETPKVRLTIEQGEDCGHDDFGDVCENIAIKMIVEYKTVIAASGIVEKTDWTLTDDVKAYEVQVRGGYFHHTRDEIEAKNIKAEIDSIEASLITITDEQLDSIKEIDSTVKIGCNYDETEGDFYNVKKTVKRFSTPLGIVESWDRDLFAEWTIGRGTPFYRNSKEYNEVNNMASAMKMNCAPDFTMFWKPNTEMSTLESYINSNESAIFNRIIELLKNK